MSKLLPFDYISQQPVLRGPASAAARSVAVAADLMWVPYALAGTSCDEIDGTKLPYLNASA